MDFGMTFEPFEGRMPTKQLACQQATQSAGQAASSPASQLPWERSSVVTKGKRSCQCFIEEAYWQCTASPQIFQGYL